MKTNTNFLVRASLCLTMLLLSGHTAEGELESVEWVPYTTTKHSEMGENSGFSRRIYDYLCFQRKLEGRELTKQFDRWYKTNLGHVFEDAALASYGILKNHRMFNGRIPDGVEDGRLEQIVQYTEYPASTFIESKCMKILSIDDPKIRHQLIDMINFLSTNSMHKTVKRFVANDLTRIPGKASEEGLAVLVFLTPYNTEVSGDLLKYAIQNRVKIFQIKMLCNPADEEMITLSNPKPLTGISLHFHGHMAGPFSIRMNWNRRLIDPDTGEEINY